MKQEALSVKWLLIGAIAFLTIYPATSFANHKRLRDGGASLHLSSDKPVLFVTHGTRGYDYSQSAKTGIDRTIAVFERMGWPTVHLNDCNGIENLKPYMEDKSPTAEICSLGGEHGVMSRNPNIFLSGGYYNACAGNTFDIAAKNAFDNQLKEKPRQRPLVVVHYILDSLYARLRVAYKQPNKYLDVFSHQQIYDKPDRYPPNQNLLEALVASGADFNNPDTLTKALPYLAAGFPQACCNEAGGLYLTYQTELYYEDRFITRLGDGQGENPPILVVCLTTSSSIAANPLAYLNFYNNLVKTKPVPEKKAFRVPPVFPGSAIGIFDRGRMPARVFHVAP